MRPADAAIYFRAMKFSLMAENGNSVRDRATPKIIDRGDGSAPINARRFPRVAKRDFGALTATGPILVPVDAMSSQETSPVGDLFPIDTPPLIARRAEP
jgi:hypothetical protein